MFVVSYMGCCSDSEYILAGIHHKPILHFLNLVHLQSSV